MSFWMNNISVELAWSALTSATTRNGPWTANNFSSPSSSFTSSSSHRFTLPCKAYIQLYFLLYLMGDVPALKALMGFLCTIFGMRWYLRLRRRHGCVSHDGIQHQRHAGGGWSTLRRQATWRLSFLLAGLFQPMFKPPWVHAGRVLLLITIMVERCAYSCGFMNPAVVFATHAYWVSDRACPCLYFSFMTPTGTSHPPSIFHQCHTVVRGLL